MRHHTAYGVRIEDISGGPAWRDKDRLNIEAKAAGPVANEQTLFLMLRSLLAGRFKRTVHRETKEIPAYDLVLGRNGLKGVCTKSSGQP